MKRILSAVAVIALLQTGGYAGVTVYEDTGYGGTSTKYEVGNHNYNEISRNAPGNDAISSVRIDPGYRVILYEHANYRGRALVLTKDTPSLLDYGANDQVSSLRVEKIPVNGNFTRWSKTGYAGQSNTWKIGEYKNVTGNFASVFIPKGFSVTLFSNANFGGNVIAIQAQNCDVWIEDLKSISPSIKSFVIDKISE